MMTINDFVFDPKELMSKDELIEFLREHGENDRALTRVRDANIEKFGNELMWHYPIMDGFCLGTFIIPILEGFLSVPYSFVDVEDYEQLDLDNAYIFDVKSMGYLLDHWKAYSGDLVSAMTDMLRILRA